MLGDAIEFPTTADDWIQTVIIGGALSLLGVLILPAIVLQGYTLRVARAGATGGPAPSFTDWGDLLIDGLKLLVLNLAAAVVVFVPLAAVVGVFGAAAGLSGSRALGGITVLVALLAIGVLSLVLGYFLPAAVANFAIEDSLAAAFDVGTVADGALTGDYATAWLLAVLIGLVGGLVGGALSAILVGFLIVFYVQVVTYYLFGRGFAAGLGMDVSARGAGAPAVGGGAGTHRPGLGDADDRTAERGTVRPSGPTEDDTQSGGDARDAAAPGGSERRSGDATVGEGTGGDDTAEEGTDDDRDGPAGDADGSDPDERGSDGPVDR